MTRGKAELLAENALLRQQLIILCRQVKRPVYKKTDRLLLVLLAMPGSFPDLPGEAALPHSQSLHRVLQSSSATSRAWTGDSRSVGSLCPSPDPTEPGHRR